MKLVEKQDHFLLTALVPEHEQKKIQVIIRGNELVLSGQRKNQEKIELSQGHSRSTSSYQSFHESLPLTYPVDELRLSKRFEGDLLIVEIPKRNSFDPNKTQAVKGRQSSEETVMAVRPDFPSNLPGEKELAVMIENQAYQNQSPEQKA